MTNPQPERTITPTLIRKRSEHNECLIHNLEEIALHQEELTSIGPYLGRVCGKTLRILLLQNNVISRMEHLRPMKALEYLNLALNNITKIEGIAHCEFLQKLDLTLNFIHVETLEESIRNLKPCRNLKELYLLGNPCYPNEGTSLEGWVGLRMYVIANLPQLQSLDGKPVLRSERIVAMQRLPDLTEQLKTLVAMKSAEKEKIPDQTDNDDNDKGLDHSQEDATGHNPEIRLQISNEMAKQKAEKEANENVNKPQHRGEKEFHQEQNETIRKTREKEELSSDDAMKQCNQGKWAYTFDDEETKPGHLLLDIPIPKYLSTGLIDVDVHPTYVSVIIKSKILRLLLPSEVKSDESYAQRSATTGGLSITMPKLNPKERIKPKAKISSDKTSKTMTTKWNKCLAADMLKDVELNKSVRLELNPMKTEIGLQAVKTRRIGSKTCDGWTEEEKHSVMDLDEPPDMF